MYVAISDRIRLRPVSESDFYFLYELFQDPLVMKYFGSTRNEEQTHKWIDMSTEHQKKYGYGKYIIEKLDGTPIGHSGLLHTLINGVDEVELGYTLAASEWHKGYATEAARLGLEYAFKTLKKKKIISAVNPLNQPSIDVALRLGMKLDQKNATGKVAHITYTCDVYAMTALEFNEAYGT